MIQTGNKKKKQVIKKILNIGRLLEFKISCIYCPKLCRTNKKLEITFTQRLEKKKKWKGMVSKSRDFDEQFHLGKRCSLVNSVLIKILLFINANVFLV